MATFWGADVAGEKWGPFPNRAAAEAYGSERASELSVAEGGAVIGWEVFSQTQPDAAPPRGGVR